MNFSVSLTIADRIGLTLDGLCRAVAARIAPGIAGWAMQAVTIQLVWTRVRRADGKIRALLARFQAGRLRVFPGRVRVRDHSRSPTAKLPRSPTAKLPRSPTAKLPRSPTAKLPRSPTAKLPRRLGWLLLLVPCEAANRSSQLRAILAEPEMQALLTASAQARRVLAPLCRMLGIEAEVLTPRAVVPPAPAVARVAFDAPEFDAPEVASEAEPPAAGPPDQIRWVGD